MKNNFIQKLKKKIKSNKEKANKEKARTVVIVKPKSQKNKKPEKIKHRKKPSYRAVMIPVFSVIALNLIFSVSLSVKTSLNNTKQINATTIAQQVTVENKFKNAKDMFYHAINNLNNSPYYTINATGEVKSFVNQKVNLIKIFDGKNHFMQNTTTGLKNNSTRIYVSNNTVKTIKSKGDLSFNKTHKPITYTYNEFEKKFSVSPTNPIPYNINDVTITNTTTPKKVAGGYEFSLSLHPKLATEKYAKNLQKLAKLNNTPTFNLVKLNVLVDENQNFVKINVVEEYNIKVIGISRLCKSNLTSHFDFSTKPKKISLI